MENVLGKLGVGPMSSEVVEAVFRYSQERGQPLMLIASKNQIDWNGGYVNNWSTAEYMNYVKELRQNYPSSKVTICRDHCGPGFKNDDLKDVYQTLSNDIENGFDLIHIDFCHFHGTYQDILQESKKAIEFVKLKKPNILIEVGTDDNKGDFLTNLGRIEEEIKFFSSITPVHFYVCQTGSLVKEINQVGKFNEKFISGIKKIANNYNVCLKEHNDDYIQAEEIKKRTGLIDAMNVAPQYGVLQTQLTLQKCVTYGIDFTEFLDEAYKSYKWKKWLNKNDANNKILCSIISGHYVFSSDLYKKIVEQINKHENFKETVIQETMKNFDLYLNNL